ncbi:MAG: hypothetical protein H0Z34_12930 [Brevibacillus sp.]|nr:hypothetical protein [Brevibacillus sp.]
MFDPIIFDNIKVVLEGAVYDRDLDGQIAVTDRADLVDLARYSRQFRIRFCLAEDAAREDVIAAEIELGTTLVDIAAEQLAQPLAEPVGCTLCIHFFLRVAEPQHETQWIASVLDDIWGHRPRITQFVGVRLDKQWSWPETPHWYENKVTLDFQRKIGERNIEDLEQLIDLCVASLIRLRSGSG